MAKQSVVLTAFLLLICLPFVTESLSPGKRTPLILQSTSSRNCTAPKPKVAGAMLKWQAGRNNSVFMPGEKAELICKEGYRQIGSFKILTCQSDGNWTSRSSFEDGQFKPSESPSGYCVTNHCNGSGLFNCTKNSESVDICKKCDCAADCRDGSDEMNCESILINVTGQATGEVKYPEHTNSTSYNGAMRCRQTLWTEDPGFYIKLLFKNFSLSEDCKDTYVFLENATFSDKDASSKCCKKDENVSCGFGAESGPPPLSHTDKNFLIITLVSKHSSSSVFIAKWYNVNGLFPYGVLPKDDAPYPDRLKIKKTPSKKIEAEGTDSTYVTAVVITSIFAFVVFIILACKVGQRFIGPKCSVGYCCAWIATRRNRRSSRATSPEATPIRREIYDESIQGSSQRRGRPNEGASASRSRYGSAAENIA